jgi:fluoroquinolone transport system ATP-binding protein
MITIKELSYTYRGSTERVLKNLNFEISRGEIFGFLGPSGAGKSTTQKVLYKILHDFTGDITVDGRGLGDWDSEYFQKIGVGFELPNHYLKLTARENLELFGSFYPENKLKDLNPLFETFGLAADADKRVEDLSKGMKMRLNFMRAIMHDPEILFLDEPTAGLDPINAQKIKRFIVQLRSEGKTVFVTTHDMTTADELCDRVAFLADGEIRLIGEPAALKNEYGRHSVKVELRDGETAEFPVDGLGTNASFLEFISGGEVLRINTQEATLEEVFIAVTGTSLT